MYINRPAVILVMVGILAAGGAFHLLTTGEYMACRDWEVDKQKGAAYARRFVMGNIHPGAIVLLHAVSTSNTEALDDIIKDLKAQGYVFLPLPAR